MKLLEENLQKKTLNALGNNFLDMTPKIQVSRIKISKMDYCKLKSLCTAKETINKVKKQPIKWEKIFVNYINIL